MSMIAASTGSCGTPAEPPPVAAAEEQDTRQVFDATALGHDGVEAVAAELRRAGFLGDRHGAGRRG